MHECEGANKIYRKRKIESVLKDNNYQYKTSLEGSSNFWSCSRISLLFWWGTWIHIPSALQEYIGQGQQAGLGIHGRLYAIIMVW